MIQLVKQQVWLRRAMLRVCVVVWKMGMVCVAVSSASCEDAFDLDVDLTDSVANAATNVVEGVAGWMNPWQGEHVPGKPCLSLGKEECVFNWATDQDNVFRCSKTAEGKEVYEILKTCKQSFDCRCWSGAGCQCVPPQRCSNTDPTVWPCPDGQECHQKKPERIGGVDPFCLCSQQAEDGYVSDCGPPPDPGVVVSVGEPCDPQEMSEACHTYIYSSAFGGSNYSNAYGGSIRLSCQPVNQESGSRRGLVHQWVVAETCAPSYSTCCCRNAGCQCTVDSECYDLSKLGTEFFYHYPNPK